MRSIRQTVFFALISWFAVASGSAAFAQDEETTYESSGPRFGLGIETVLTAPFTPSLGTAAPVTPAGAAALIYDAEQFRIDALLFLLFVDDVSTTFALGGRFFYVIHRARNADFSLGGGLALGLVDPAGGPSDADFRLAIEGAAQIRVFMASNVALTASVGLGFSFDEDDFIFALGGQLTGGFGLVYFF